MQVQAASLAIWASSGRWAKGSSFVIGPVHRYRVKHGRCVSVERNKEVSYGGEGR